MLSNSTTRSKLLNKAVRNLARLAGGVRSGARGLMRRLRRTGRNSLLKIRESLIPRDISMRLFRKLPTRIFWESWEEWSRPSPFDCCLLITSFILTKYLRSKHRFECLQYQHLLLFAWVFDVWNISFNYWLRSANDNQLKESLHWWKHNKLLDSFGNII